MIRDGSFLNAFRLMPLEDGLRPVIEADWTFEEIDRNRRLIRFEDRSRGKIEKRRWNFGDGTGSDDPCPVHCYPKAGEWTVTLYVEGPDGSDRRIKVWEVVTK